MSDLDRLLQQVEELKRLAARPDDSWMDTMSHEELQALGKKVRKVADGLSGIQTQLAGSVGAGAGRSNPRGVAPPRSTPRPPAASGSLGSLLKRDSTTSRRPQQPPARAQPSARSKIPGHAPGGTPPMDLSTPRRRRVGGAAIPREAPPPAAPGQYRPNFPNQGARPGETPPPRGRNRPSA
ncbi:MAG: hypothetical protein NVSMB32_05640 [Actinomycetota bacterium]